PGRRVPGPGHPVGVEDRDPAVGPLMVGRLPEDSAGVLDDRSEQGGEPVPGILGSGCADEVDVHGEGDPFVVVVMLWVLPVLGPRTPGGGAGPGRPGCRAGGRSRPTSSAPGSDPRESASRASDWPDPARVR